MRAAGGAGREKTAFLPDYGFKSIEIEVKGTPAEETTPEPAPWPAVNAGTSVAGIVGGLMTLVLSGLVGFVLKARSMPCAGGAG